MDGKRLIEKIKLRNILSFGDKGEEIELQPLNVLIGQNGSGKSNFIDILKLLRSLPQDKGIANFISKNGGISEWIWKGKSDSLFADVKVHIGRIYYNIHFTDDNSRLKISFEQIYRDGKIDIANNPKGFRLQNAPKVNYRGDDTNSEESVLTMDVFETIREYNSSSIIKKSFIEFKIFSDLLTNRKSEIRKPQLPDSPNDFLEEDGSNLALVLNDLEHRGDTKDKIIEYLKKFNPRVKDYSVRILGGTVQIFIREKGLEKPISAMRLSDGTLRYLCLLTILLHPEPPRLICIEEPEVGLHPDILPTIGELLIDASSRTQLIVTTHSDILVSALSEVPEAVLVCESDEDGTHLKRLEKDKLKLWLEEYSLGEAWLRGAIGGTRW